MFVVTLTLTGSKERARELMDAHNQWIDTGFSDGTFLLTGNQRSAVGGAIIARGDSRKVIEARLQKDPFVAENIVTPHIIAIETKRAVRELELLLNGAYE